MHDLKDLNEQFKKAKEIDRPFFAEYRNFANLYAGNHYLRRTESFKRYARDGRTKKDKYQIRVTRNHTKVIVKGIVNSILSNMPGVKPFPNNLNETSDMKSASLHDSIWQDFKHKARFKKKLRRYVEQLVIFGECWVFPYWDSSKGRRLQDAQEIDPITGQVLSQAPRFSGEVCLKNILPYDVRRDPGAKTKEEAKWIGYTELRDKDELKSELPEELHKFIETASRENQSILSFNYSSGKYQDEENKVEVNHIFYRPTEEKPEGSYCVFTEAGKLYEDDELPAGLFPMLCCDYDELPGSPRAVSGLREGKGYQMDINYLVSQRLKHMLTVGDDKIIIQAGSTISHGEELPGIRSIKVNGPAPTILNGRTGDQYTDPLTRTISEYYQAMGVQELLEEKQSGQFDAFAMLFRSARHKQRFATYTSKVEEFCREICEAVLRLNKAYLTEESFIKIVGQSEYVNIPEFKNSDDLGYSIRIEEVGDDADTKVGKALAIKDIMQYSGGNLSPEQIGMFIREMPYLNGEKIFEKMTQPYDRAMNVILQLDRGEVFKVNESDPHVDYIIDALYTRMSKADFKYLDMRVQQNYSEALSIYEQIKTAQLQKAQQLEQGFIPTTGPTVPIDGLYEETIGSQGQPKSQRVKLPLAALQWLQQTLAQRGEMMGNLQDIPPSLQAQLANSLAIQNEQQAMQEEAAMNPAITNTL